MGLFNKEEETVEEPEQECTFQCAYDSDEKEWNCALHTQEEFFCDKSKCPFWKNG